MSFLFTIELACAESLTMSAQQAVLVRSELYWCLSLKAPCDQMKEICTNVGCRHARIQCEKAAVGQHCQLNGKMLTDALIKATASRNLRFAEATVLPAYSGNVGGRRARGSRRLKLKASGGVLQKFTAVESGYQPVGPALGVPGNVRGMGLIDEHVAVISDEGVFSTGDLNSSWLNSSSHEAADGPLGLLGERGHTVAAAAALLPLAPSVELSAASLSGGGVDDVGVAAIAIIGSDGLSDAMIGHGQNLACVGFAEASALSPTSFTRTTVTV
ncbi:unnamed protein product [Symbiodinium natans]|uniref:Uncharacterized protein n=1 Tax=Symbiodinium natans TaxID=878477 RepID=A0A812RKS1_9DINO|nr:unnamed protein product [Symbiodinium natans]